MRTPMATMRPPVTASMARRTFWPVRNLRMALTMVASRVNQTRLTKAAVAESAIVSAAVAEGGRNCGSSATKKTATFGFSRLVNRPWRNAAPTLRWAGPVVVISA
jgi:hypothetical protein